MSSSSYISWIYHHLCNQGVSPLTLWARIPLRRGVLDTTLCDKVCPWLALNIIILAPNPLFFNTCIFSRRFQIIRTLYKYTFSIWNHWWSNNCRTYSLILCQRGFYSSVYSHAISINFRRHILHLHIPLDPDVYSSKIYCFLIMPPIAIPFFSMLKWPSPGNVDLSGSS